MWSVEIAEILEGDQAIGLAYATPAQGVVISPVTNFGTARGDGRLITNTSEAVRRKLERIRRHPQVALAFHTRTHGDSDRPEYVLVQGRARLSEPIPEYPDTMPERWEHKTGPRGLRPLWDRWLRVYHRRVEIAVQPERLVVWPDLACDGEPEVLGAPLPAEPPPQDPPRNGTGPRVNHERVARHGRRLPNVLLGWVGADGFPVVVPARTGATGPHGIAVAAPLLPPGGRRAGLTAHAFTKYVLGQDQHIQTGWLSDGVYAPHTHRGYRLPGHPLIYRPVVGFETRRRRRFS